MRLLIAIALLSGVALAGAPAEFYVHDGDTVVFFGDSITNQRLYTVYTEAYVLTRFPQLHVTFVHSGWSGDRVSGGAMGPIDLRLDRDVFAHGPTVITIMLGMNDGEYQPFDDGIFDKFTTGYRHILDTIKARAPEARVTVMEPSAYDDFTRPPDFAGGYNAVLLKFGKFIRELGIKKGLTVADLNAPVVSLLKAANSTHLIPDRVHPSTGIHLVMAEALLRAWHAPAVVSAVEIDGASGEVANAENTTVDAIRHEDGLTWKQMDKSLPMPVETHDDMIALAVRYSDFTDALNRETLTVTGLSAGNYRLQIDEDAVGVFDARQLAKGVNLAILKTPMSRQAKTVLDLTYRHNHLRFARMMMVENALKEYHPAKLDATLDAMDSLEEEVISLQRAAAIPKAHRYRLAAVSTE
ncbi:MAG: SGNH/GDSL hydrolase family protein [Bryobacteraceae bacterium]